MYNLQLKVTRVKRIVKYLEAKDKPTFVKRFRPDFQPCGKVKATVKANGKLVTVTDDCNCHRCKAYDRVLQEIRAANPKAYRIVIPKLG